jgi:hypothetical protein
MEMRERGDSEMKSSSVKRGEIKGLTDLPNVGPAMARDLALLSIRKPEQLAGRDPCVLDTFIAITRFMGGEAAKPWWAYTAERKKRFGAI